MKPVKDELAAARQRLSMEIDYVMISTRKQIEDVIRALGDVSYEEAIDGIIKFFTEEMEKLK